MVTELRALPTVLIDGATKMVPPPVRRNDVVRAGVHHSQ